jgi:hypothetical protein
MASVARAAARSELGAIECVTRPDSAAEENITARQAPIRSLTNTPLAPIDINYEIRLAPNIKHYLYADQYHKCTILDNNYFCENDNI